MGNPKPQKKFRLRNSSNLTFKKFAESNGTVIFQIRAKMGDVAKKNSTYGQLQAFCNTSNAP